MSERELIKFFNSAIDAVDPFKAVLKAFTIKNSTLHYGSDESGKITRSIKDFDKISVIGCGKAVFPMYAAVETVCGQYIQNGVLITKRGHKKTDVNFKNVEIIEASHPIPDTLGLSGVQKTVEILRNATANNLIIALVSGGGSALWTLPENGITMIDIQKITRLFLESGATIQEINTIRKRISQLQGGKAACLAYPANVIAFIISDVIGDPLETIASGPFSPDTTTFADAFSIIDKYKMSNEIPSSIMNLLIDGTRERIQDTPKSGNVCFNKVANILVSTNKIALQAIFDTASQSGYECILLDQPLQGEARIAARYFCDRIMEIKATNGSQSICLISGGETTVSLGKQYGKGGRNQEFALAAALFIQGTKGISILSCGTDGNDGPTDAAGAYVDSMFIDNCLHMGLSAEEYLDAHDSYSLFEKTGNLIKTGPTLTNVMDVQIAIIER